MPTRDTALAGAASIGRQDLRDRLRSVGSLVRTRHHRCAAGAVRLRDRALGLRVHQQRSLVIRSTVDIVQCRGEPCRLRSRVGSRWINVHQTQLQHDDLAHSFRCRLQLSDPGPSQVQLTLQLRQRLGWRVKFRRLRMKGHATGVRLMTGSHATVIRLRLGSHATGVRLRIRQQAKVHPEDAVFLSQRSHRSATLIAKHHAREIYLHTRVLPQQTNGHDVVSMRRRVRHVSKNHRPLRTTRGGEDNADITSPARLQIAADALPPLGHPPHVAETAQVAHEMRGGGRVEHSPHRQLHEALHITSDGAEKCRRECPFLFVPSLGAIIITCAVTTDHSSRGRAPERRLVLASRGNVAGLAG